jgi:hypothetical protein
MKKKLTLLFCFITLSAQIKANEAPIIPKIGFYNYYTHTGGAWLNEKSSPEVIVNYMKTMQLGHLTSKENIYAELVDTNSKSIEQEIKNLSKQKWDWMSDKNVDSLNLLFDEKCNFVHMGGTWGKDREIDIIKNGFIWYKKAEIYTSSAEVFGNMVVLLSDIDLIAMVGGKEAINPFMVTEVYFKENNHWKLGQLTFSHLARALKLKTNIPQQ